MNARPFLMACLLVLLGCAAWGADKGAPSPDPEFLEFLGTFETAGGKAIDPLLLEKKVPKNDTPKKEGERKPAPRKVVREKTPPHGREHEDE